MSDIEYTSAEVWKRIALEPKAADVLLRPGGLQVVVGGIALVVVGETPVRVVLYSRGGTRKWMTITEWRQWLGATPVADEPELLPEPVEPL